MFYYFHFNHFQRSLIFVDPSLCIWYQIICYHIPLAWRTDFNISYSIGLLVTNSISFSVLVNFVFIFKNSHLRICSFIDFTERKGEREALIGCLPYTPQPEIEPTPFWCMAWCPNPLTHPARAFVFIFDR